MPTEPLKRLTTPDWVFKGELSNLTGHFSYDRLGVHKLLSKKLFKHNFPEQFANDIARIYRLSRAQEKILAVMIAHGQFAKEFSLTDENELFLSIATGLKRTTVRYSFHSLRGNKKLVLKTGKKVYSLNREHVFHINDLKPAHFANVVLGYEFYGEPESSPEIPLEAEDEK